MHHKPLVFLDETRQRKPQFLPRSSRDPVSRRIWFPCRHLESKDLVHLADEGVDLLLAVAEVTTLNEVLELARAEAAGGVGQLEGPQEVGSLLEVGADGVDLVDEILHADDAVLAEVLFNDGVVGEGNALLVDLAVSALVDKLLDGLQVGVTVGDPGLDDLDHLGGGLGDTDENTVVDLEQTEELEDLAGLGGDLVDTLDADQEDQVGTSGNVGRVALAGNTSETDLLALSLAVLLDVLLGTLEDDLALLLVGGLGLLLGGVALGASLLLRLPLLEESLGDKDVLLGRDGTRGRARLVRSPAYRGMKRSAVARIGADAAFSLWLTRKLNLIGVHRDSHD